MRELLHSVIVTSRSASACAVSRERQHSPTLRQYKASRHTNSRATLKHSCSAARLLAYNARRVLVQSAAEFFTNSVELERLISSKLGIDEAATQQLLYQQRTGKQHQCLQDANTTDIEAGLDRLLLVFSSSEVVHLLQQQPALLAAPLTAWLDFFAEFGFSSGQVKNLISQTPEVLVKGSLVTAGDAIMHLKQLGFDNDEVRHRVVAYCPQILMMQAADIDTLIALWSKFQVGVDERSGM